MNFLHEWRKWVCFEVNFQWFVDLLILLNKNEGQDLCFNWLLCVFGSLYIYIYIYMMELDVVFRYMGCALEKSWLPNNVPCGSFSNEWWSINMFCFYFYFYLNSNLKKIKSWVIIQYLWIQLSAKFKYIRVWWTTISSNLGLSQTLNPYA
jgi:hypothetical protein